MDAYDRCSNLGKEILPIVLPSMVEAENFSDHPHIYVQTYSRNLLPSPVLMIGSNFH